MPSAKVCGETGCHEVVVGSSRCPAHARQRWAPAYDTTPRVSGRRLQLMRQQLFTREPFCRECSAKEGRYVEATIRDHIIPLAEGGTDDPINIQPLCQAHSDAKTRLEAMRGHARARGGA